METRPTAHAVRLHLTSLCSDAVFRHGSVPWIKHLDVFGSPPRRPTALFSRTASVITLVRGDARSQEEGRAGLATVLGAPPCIEFQKAPCVVADGGGKIHSASVKTELATQLKLLGCCNRLSASLHSLNACEFGCALPPPFQPLTRDAVSMDRLQRPWRDARLF